MSLPEQEVVEEGALALDVLRLVVVGPLLAAVDVEPLLLRRDAPEALQGAAGVQPLVRPAGHHEGRHADGLEVGGLARPEVVVPGVCGRLGLQVLDLGGAGPPSLPDVGPEGGLRDAAVPGDLAIGVVPPLPRVDRRQVRRVQGGDEPLQARQVGDPGQPDLARAPGLGAGPLHQVGEGARLLRRVVGGPALRVPGAGHVDEDDGVAVRDPVLRVRRLERGQVRGPLRPDAAVRVDLADRGRVVLAVRRPAHQRRRRHVALGAVDVDVHDVSLVPERNGDVLLDDHARAVLEPVLGRAAAARLGRAARARNRYSVVASSMELLLDWSARPEPGMTKGRPVRGRAAPPHHTGVTRKVVDRVVALAVVLLHDHRGDRGLTVLGGVHRRVRAA